MARLATSSRKWLNGSKSRLHVADAAILEKAQRLTNEPVKKFGGPAEVQSRTEIVDAPGTERRGCRVHQRDGSEGEREQRQQLRVPCGYDLVDGELQVGRHCQGENLDRQREHRGSVPAAR